jgi:hypothetical protein
MLEQAVHLLELEDPAADTAWRFTTTPISRYGDAAIA